MFEFLYLRYHNRIWFIYYDWHTFFRIYNISELSSLIKLRQSQSSFSYIVTGDRLKSDKLRAEAICYLFHFTRDTSKIARTVSREPAARVHPHNYLNLDQSAVRRDLEKAARFFPKVFLTFCNPIVQKKNTFLRGFGFTSRPSSSLVPFIAWKALPNSLYFYGSFVKSAQGSLSSSVVVPILFLDLDAMFSQC